MNHEDLNNLLSKDEKPAPKKRKPRYIKPQAVKKLEAAVQKRREEERHEHSLPYKPEKKYTDADANGLTECIIAYIGLIDRCTAYRVNNTGIYDAKLGRHRKSNTIKGIADITACVRGQFVQIEVKHGKDRMSDGQKKFRQRIEDAGGVYIIARTFEGFVLDFKKIFVN